VKPAAFQLLSKIVIDSFYSRAKTSNKNTFETTDNQAQDQGIVKKAWGKLLGNRIALVDF
jgi:hypothetical protein